MFITMSGGMVEIGKTSSSRAPRRYSLTLEPGPTTLAACGPDSLSDLYLTTLADVVSVSQEEGRLVLHLRDNGGTIVFDFGRG